MPLVTFKPEKVSVEVEPGTSLLDAARRAGVRIRNDCGGQGACGRCVVRVQTGRVHRLSHSHELEEGEDLACRTIVLESDVIVQVPESSREAEEDVSIYRTGPVAAELPPENAVVRKVKLSVPEPTLENHLPDDERLLRALKDWQEANYTIPAEALSDLPGRLRESGWRPHVTVGRGPCGYEVIEIEKDGSAWPCMLAVDVGTTSLKAELIAPSGHLAASCYNSQIAYGPDVISRIIHAQQNDDGLARLQRLVVGDVNRLVTALLGERDLDAEQILAVVASGNTTMMHLLLGIEPTWIRRQPYVGCSYRLPPVRAAALGIHIHPRGLVYCLPSVSSYVGGDITAGVLATGLERRDAPAMLIDLGTNGEIVIGNRDFMVCCSASAGPAFEGESGTSGTRAMPGAIDTVTWNDDLMWRTIGDELPMGICGSGYIDLLAALAGRGIINRSGKLQPGSSPHVREADEGGLEYVVVDRKEAAAEKAIVLTQADIDNLVRAKGAIYAAANVLLSSLGMSWNDLEAIMLAGSFGDKIDKENAVRIGLLPDVPREKIRFVGNTSLRGAVMAAVSENEFERAQAIARGMTYFELSTHPDYMEEFMAACFLPHTHADEFPSVVLGVAEASKT